MQRGNGDAIASFELAKRGRGGTVRRWRAWLDRGDVEAGFELLGVVSLEEGGEEVER